MIDFSISVNPQFPALAFFYSAANRHIHSEKKNDGVATVKREKVAAGEGVQVCLQDVFVFAEQLLPLYCAVLFLTLLCPRQLETKDDQG